MTLAELLAAYGVPAAPGDHHHRSRGWEQADCPRCSPGTGRWRLGLRPGRGWLAANCWSCGRLDALETLAELTGEKPGRLRTLLGGLEEGPGGRDDRDGRRGRLVTPEGAGPLLPAHRRYLEGRGIDPDEAEATWDARGIGVAPRLSWRILIWIQDFSGQKVSWTSRSIGDQGLRYISARPEEEKAGPKSVLFGEHRAGHAILIVEGPLDVWRVGPGAVATLGLNYTPAQVRRMAAHPVRWVAFDREEQAQRRARKLCEELSAFPGQTALVEIDAKDPGSASEGEVRELRRLLK